jgi:hypothetical protein
MYTEQDCQAAIDCLQEFRSTTRGMVEQIKGAADTCVANMEGDNVSQGASADLKRVMNSVEDILDNDLCDLISKLEEEKEKARAAAEYEGIDS